MSLLLMISEGFQVKGPSAPLVVALGGSVVLNCSVDKPLLMEGLEVEWRRTDSETLVHLFQDGMSRPEARHQDYHDRAHFFTEEIRHGNFSLLLNSVRAEDEGEYRCKVHSDQESDETVVEIKAERLIVSGSNHSISAYAGEDITLSCSVDSHIPPEEIEEVSWKKIDKDELILVLLYQNHTIEADSAYERYRDRAEFFTDEIPKGNFSIRLKNVRTEDKGVYMCHVFARGLSVNATVVLEQLGFSTLHIMVLILCITASGSTLLLCCLIYCRSQDKDTAARKHVRTLGCVHIFFPNIISSFAFILWGITEGSLYETISCCSLQILRPLMLIWTAPYLEDFPDIIRKWIKSSVLRLELGVFGILYYSVFLRRIWERILLDKVNIITFFGVLVLLSFLYIIRRALMFIFCYCIAGLFYNGSAFSRRCVCVKKKKIRLHFLDKTVWIILMFVMNAALVYYYVSLLKNEIDRAGWTCTALFLQTLWIITFHMELSSNLEMVVPKNLNDSTVSTVLFMMLSAGLFLLKSTIISSVLSLISLRLPGDRLNGFENGKTQLFNSRGVGKLDYFQKKERCSEATLTELNQCSGAMTKHRTNKQKQHNNCIAPHRGGHLRCHLDLDVLRGLNITLLSVSNFNERTNVV
ncbi:hypothetical protein ABG768_021789 [Culter alburnus]|uniref:Ig-like domain-containing protein n=1 Tax=Culter alburnus TaxID=194366 RepID=A0AAW2AS49_CULAL